MNNKLNEMDFKYKLKSNKVFEKYRVDFMDLVNNFKSKELEKELLLLADLINGDRYNQYNKLCWQDLGGNFIDIEVIYISHFEVTGGGKVYSIKDKLFFTNKLTDFNNKLSLPIINYNFQRIYLNKDLIDKDKDLLKLEYLKYKNLTDKIKL